MNLDAYQIPESELHWDIKEPCADCPFRKSSPFHKGVAGSLPSYVETIEANRFVHTCHKTDNRPSCDGPRNHHGPVQACAGATLMLIKTGDGADLQLPLLRAAEAGRVNLSDMVRRAADAADVFTLPELLRFYRDQLEVYIRDVLSDPPVCCVFEENPGDPPTMVRLSQARAQGLDILECLKCGAPAVEYDGHWPYYQSNNFCQQHSEDGIYQTRSILRSLVEESAKTSPSNGVSDVSSICD